MWSFFFCFVTHLLSSSRTRSFEQLLFSPLLPLLDTISYFIKKLVLSCHCHSVCFDQSSGLLSLYTVQKHRHSLPSIRPLSLSLSLSGFFSVRQSMSNFSSSLETDSIGQSVRRQRIAVLAFLFFFISRKLINQPVITKKERNNYHYYLKF